MATGEAAERPPTRHKEQRRGKKRHAGGKGVRMLRLPLKRGGAELQAMASVSGVHTALAVRVDGVLLGFDAGFNLEQLSRARHLFLSHGHVDHAGALPLIVSRRGAPRLPPRCGRVRIGSQPCGLGRPPLTRGTCAELVGIKKVPVVYAPEPCVGPIEALLEAYRELSGVRLRGRAGGAAWAGASDLTPPPHPRLPVRGPAARRSASRAGCRACGTGR